MENITLYKGDCLKLFENIPDNSIDLVLTDPPYNIISDKRREDYKINGGIRLKEIGKWDKPINEKEMLKNIKRVLRPNGKALLFCQEPYTSKLILCNMPPLAFAQRLAWKKNNVGNFLCATKNCMQYIEDIVVFRKGHAVYDEKKENPLRKYFLDELEKSGLTVAEINKIIGSKGMASHYFTNGVQFCIPTKSKYNLLQKTGFFQRSYEEIKKENDEFNKKLFDEKEMLYPSLFNLNGKRSKSNVFEYAKEANGYHPTQKPIALLVDLIETYSREGDTVLDFTMGSGSTGVACVNTNRRFIGIELDNNYFNIAEKRINEAVKDNEIEQMRL